MNRYRLYALLGGVTCSAVLGLSGCGGGSDYASPTVTTGGALTGLAASESVVLSINGDTTVMLSQNGSYQFSGTLPFDGSYAVTVAQQPVGQTCTVANGTGAGVTGNVANINVSCSTDTYTVSGMVSGLASGATVVLSDNGSDALTITGNGAFAFGAPVNYNGAYAITVATQPTGQVCTVGNGTGLGVTANVSNLAITCQAQTFLVSGVVSSMQSGTQVTLMNNAADPVVVSGNGAFSFDMPVSYGSSYAVTVNQQPAGQTCTVSQGTGSNVAAAITGVAVSCAPDGYTVGGTVSGLASGAQVTLFDNGGDALVVNANGAFSFATLVVPGGAYAVTINQQPVGQTCTVASGSGSGTASGNVANIAVTCVSALTIGGTVSGLPGSTQVTLTNNGGDALTVSSDGAFVFATGVATNASYLVKVSTQPSGASCVVNNNSGTATNASIANIAVTCSSSSNILSLLQFRQGQVADAQWNVGACTTTNTCVIFSDAPGTAYLTPFTSGRFNWTTCGAGSYISFDPHLVGGVQDTVNPWSENLYQSNGTLCQAGGNGHFVSVGLDSHNNAYLFYVGSDNNTGTLASPQAPLTGAGFSFTGAHNPTLAQVTQYLQ